MKWENSKRDKNYLRNGKSEQIHSNFKEVEIAFYNFSIKKSIESVSLLENSASLHKHVQNTVE